ncbi:AAA-domain-containing protein [Rickenella mellea]|uniref:Peroxisomal ATPase PEX6 n=1 Tax=Rickenella mellea TaxID=50990 RepID=A0A4Y7QBW2_9AGAM|nr:AAA-domain-containing protein [Rickenella mellea]
MAFEVARDNQTKFSNWLSGNRRIIRGGDKLACTLFSGRFFDQPGVSSTATLAYQVATTTPVVQGYARPGITRIYVAPASLGIARESDMVNRPTRSDNNSIQCQEGVHTKDGMDDVFEIDERFFASSLRTWPHSSSTQSFRRPGEILQNNDVGNTWLFQAEALSGPLDSDADVNASIFVRTTDLVKIGVLEGDWAVASEPHAGGSRLVQIFTADNLIQTPGVVLASPLLLHNVSYQKWVSGCMPILLRASPFGSCLPSLPTAATMTLVCITSPVSSNRLYQPLYHHALKAYFEGKKSLVKKDDLIAVPINIDELQDTDGMDMMSSETYDCYDYCYRCVYLTFYACTAIVFFAISHVEYSVVADTEDRFFDFYNSSRMGELGCWIEPSATTVIQTSTKHAVVPDASRFLNMEFSTNTMKNIQELNYSRNAAMPILKLQDLASVIITSSIIQYDLCPSVLLKGTQGMEMSSAAHHVALHLGLHICEINCYEVAGESGVKTEGILRANFEKASACSPCMMLLQNIDAFVQTTQFLDEMKENSIVHVLKECINDLCIDWKCSGFPVLVVGTTCNSEQIPSNLLSVFKQEISFPPPTEVERVNALNLLSEDKLFTQDISFNHIATQTASFVFEDLKEILSRACWNATERAFAEITDFIPLNHHISLAGFPLSGLDINYAVQQVRASYSISVGAPKIPNVTWEDVGGLAKVKEDILDTIQLPLEQPELFADGLKKRSGLLLYGPPGTGKTLLAKAVATSCSLNFFSIKGPELLNMYIGESEANVRRVFQQARDATPCVIFFDELDSVAPKRGNHGDSGGVMDRIVSQLLAELDGISRSQVGADIFVIGATNRPDLLDPALLRPGRFDRLLYLGVSDTHDAQFHILVALTRKFTLDDHLVLQDIAEQCPFNFTGADFYALCSDAMLKAMSRKAREIENKIDDLNHSAKVPGHHYPITAQYYLGELSTASDTDVRISQQDFEEALDALVPSVSLSEMNHYAAIQQKFSQQG